MSFISYAQNFEDVMLWRALKHVEIGFYIDVGANDPHQDSVTRAFYEHGWRGINIEPVSQWFEKLVRERPRDINLQVAAGAQTGETKIFEISDTGLSTMDKVIAERHEAERGYQIVEYKVPVMTLTEICSSLHMAPIHFLKIDVEGAEKQVLEGIDFSVIRPWIILIESTLPTTQIEDYSNWEPILLNANYEYVYFDGLNRFYVAQERSELRNSFRTPPNVFDGFVLSGESTSSFCNLVVAQAKQSTIEGSFANDRIKQLCAQLDELNQRHSESNTALIEQQAHAQHLQDEWDTAKVKIDELNHSSHHWWTVADGLSHEIQALYNSKSWRITWPLRMVMRSIRQLSFPLIRLIRWLCSLPKRIVKRILRIAVRYVLARPGLLAKGTRLLANRPRLKARLRPLVNDNGILTYRSGSAEPSRVLTPGQSKNIQINPDFPQLTYHAQRIYDDLTKAIAKQQKEDN